MKLKEQAIKKLDELRPEALAKDSLRKCKEKLWAVRGIDSILRRDGLRKGHRPCISPVHTSRREAQLSSQTVNHDGERR